MATVVVCGHWDRRRVAGPRSRRVRRHAKGSDDGGGQGAARISGGLLVICGPSGVGKSTLVQRLLQDTQVKERLALVVSHTTRPPRLGEVNGVHYHFTERQDMEAMVQEGAFLEHAEVHGQLYGTSFAAVAAAQRGGRVCLLDIDLQGARSVRRHLAPGGMLAGGASRAKFAFIQAEGGLGTLEARLRARSKDSEDSIRRRMETARRELDEYTTLGWDCVILNQEGQLDNALRLLRGLLDGLLLESESLVRPALLLEATIGRLGQEGAPRKNVFVEISGLARKLGSDCVDLGQGFPNFDPPDFVVQALRDELESQSGGGPRIRHQYTRTAGHVPLVEVIAERYSGHLGRHVDALREVAVTSGATGGLFLALQAALSQAERRCPGSGAREIVVLEPFFELYRSQAQGLKAKLRTVPLSFDPALRSFQLDTQALKEALGTQTAALIVNTPHNPTGKAFEEGELLAMAELVKEHPHICVISDEVYKYMIFDPPDGAPCDALDKPAGHVHFAALPGMWDQTITVSSAGKTFGITGWQIGWVVGANHWLEHIHRFMPNLQFCAPTLMQRALGRVLETAKEPYLGASSYYAWLRQVYRRRRSLMAEALEGAGVTTVRSQGGFFMLGDVSRLCGESGPLCDSWAASLRQEEPQDWTFCRALAAKLGIVALPVSPFFGPTAPADVKTRFVRFCFAKTDETLEEARQRLQRLEIPAAP